MQMKAENADGSRKNGNADLSNPAACVIISSAPLFSTSKIACSKHGSHLDSALEAPSAESSPLLRPATPCSQ